MDMVFDWWRWLNVVLAVMAAGRLVELRWHRWSRLYTDRDKKIWQALFGAALAGALGSIENVIQDNPPGGRVALTTIYLAFTLWATYLPFDERKWVVDR